MRIWSLHPKYLDAKGIVALWREALLAKHVLENKTKGYKHHPQLIRFKKVKIQQMLSTSTWMQFGKNLYREDIILILQKFQSHIKR